MIDYNRNDRTMQVLAKEVIEDLRKKLLQNADQNTLESSSRFFKKGETALVYGVKLPFVRKLAADFYKQIKGISKVEIFDICDTLWHSKYLEEAVVACVCTEALYKKYEPEDFKKFMYWVEHCVNNWADCDTLCTNTIGKFVMIYPAFLKELKKWSYSSHRWSKRAAAVTMITPARKGLFLKDIFQIADNLLLDKDDLVQKGYGWMLKSASHAHPKEVFEYVMSKKDVMPRTAFRYAIEKLPTNYKIKAMSK